MDDTILLVTYLIILLAIIAGIWKAYSKAGAPGWAAIVPIYNVYVMTKMAGKSPWWVVVALIPVVNIIAAIVLSIGVAKGFGKSTVYGVALALFSFIFWPILGFGSATWKRPPVGS